jgi:phosphomannomutase / phosphoglucomutase
MKSRSLFGTNGVRGIFGIDLTYEKVIRLSKALAHHFPQGILAIGFDGRNSSPIISRMVCSTLNSEGRDIRLGGLLPTPCLQYAIKYMGYAGGLMITASHNPPEYNGIKPIAKDGIEISREDELKVQEIFYSNGHSSSNPVGREFVEEHIVESYMETVSSLVNIERIRDRKLKIVVDGGNGVQGPVGSSLIKMLGCEVLTLNCNVDGDFPGRGPEPTVDNLKLLSETAISAGADVGVAYDGDGDRSIFCDEKGQPYSGDKTGALLVKYLLSTKRLNTAVVCPINTTLAVSVVAKENRSNVIYTKVGSVEVSREMAKSKSTIGMEENGGFMYGKLNEVRDGAMTTALILEMLATHPTDSFSKLMNSLPRIFQFKSKYPCPTKAIADKVMNKVLGHGNPKKIETLDGIKAWIDEETWIMVRPSGTEPIIRLYAESTDKTLLDSKIDEYVRLIRQGLQSTGS